MGEVVTLPVITCLPIAPDRVIGFAAEQKFERVMIIGVTEEGAEYFAASNPDGGVALWDMERARHKLMQIADEGEE